MPPSAALPIEPLPEQFSHAGARWLAATRPAFLSVSLAGAVLGVAASLPADSPLAMALKRFVKRAG